MVEYKYKLVIIVLIIGAMFIPAFRPTTALSNILRYSELRKSVSSTNKQLDTVDNSISALRKKVNELRGDSVDAESANDVYEKVSAIGGITSIEAKVISINQDTSAVIGDFDPKADNSKIDGLQVTIYVDNVDTFITELSKLSLPYEAINVVYTENKLVIKFNVKGGLV